MRSLTQAERENVGRYDARYRAFLATVTELRPRLHRYCSRMTGSVLHGEDVVQEALFQAYRRLDTYDGDRPLTPWLFRIAHNACIDFLRREGSVLEQARADPPEPEPLETQEPNRKDVRVAIERLVQTLPPMERACVLLKDVFDYSLEEIATLVESTVGGVKSALSRGRAKLAAEPPSPAAAHIREPGKTRLLELYVERFNNRDWNGVRALTSADARLLFADGFAGRLVDSPYFVEYERAPLRWRMAVGDVDGEPVAVLLEHDAGNWRPHSVVRLEIAADRIERIVDYFYCGWLLPAADAVSVTAPAPTSGVSE